MGNSQISGKMIASLALSLDKTLSFEQELQLPVSIERLDAILDATRVDKIRLVKMDVQGFECNAVNGMGLVGKKIEMMKFNLSKRCFWLMCMDLVKLVKELGLGSSKRTRLVR
jgi:FkbM family methyltransferase